MALSMDRIRGMDIAMDAITSSSVDGAVSTDDWIGWFWMCSHDDGCLVNGMFTY